MRKLNYTKLMSHNPSKIDSMVNNYQQKVTFYENPIHGEESPVIAVWHDKQQAFETDFYETDDMMSEDYDDYQPIFTGDDCVCFFDLG